MSLDPIPDELKDIENILNRKNLNFQENNILKNSSNARNRGIYKNQGYIISPLNHEIYSIFCQDLQI